MAAHRTHVGRLPLLVLALVVLLAVGAAPAQADEVQFASFSDSIGNGNDLSTSNGRLNRDTIVSTCASAKSSPGPLGSGARHYDVFPFTSIMNGPACITATLDSACGATIFASAYTPSFDPINHNNYLADAGSSSIEQVMSFNIAAGGVFEAIVEEVNAGTTCAYTYAFSSDRPWAIARPGITGNQPQGQPLTTNVGAWAGSPTFAPQWLRCDGAGAACVPIPGATGSSYTPSNDDAGHTLRSRITATAGTTSASVDSAPTALIAAVPDVSVEQAAVQNDPTLDSSIEFDVVFDEPVTGFTSSDVALSGTAGATAASVTGSGTTYTVAVTGMASPGTVIASIASGAASDVDGNLNTASTSVDNTVSWELPSPPSVTMSSLAPDPTTISPIPVTVTFTEAVTGFTAADISATNGTVSNFTGSGATYSYDLTPAAPGLVSAGIPAGAAQDNLGTANIASAPFNRTFAVAPVPPVVPVPPKKARLVISHRRVKLVRHRAVVSVRCVAAADKVCAGTFRLKPTRLKARATAAAAAGRKIRFRIADGKRRVLRVPLPKLTEQQVKRSGRAVVVAVAVTNGSTRRVQLTVIGERAKR